MKQRWMSWLMAVVLLGGTAGVALAAEEGSSMPQPASTSASSTPTPQILSAEGTISALDLQAASPSLQLTAADGKVWNVAVEPQATMVWRNGQMAKLDQLKAGERVKVRYTEKDGRHVAKSIQLAQAPAAAPAK